jgi:hypothetical protein
VSSAVLRGLAVAAVLALPAAIGAATPTPAALLARYAPVVVLHPAEQLSPVTVDGFLADSDLKEQNADGSWTVVGDGGSPLPTAGGPWRLDQRLCSVRDGIGATACYAAAEAAYGAAPTVYGAYFQRGNRIALQYWLFYVFNPYSPEIPPNPRYAQLHEGDWELVTLILDRTGKPLTAGYSRHCSGARRGWAKVEKRGRHPVVYVALGSHANYFRPGRFALDERCWPAVAKSVFEQNGRPLVDFAARGRTLRPRVVRISASSPRWMRFPGTWGEDQIIDIADATLTYGASPTGPALSRAWKDPFGVPLRWPKG